jgi:hypothetical protein
LLPNRMEKAETASSSTFSSGNSRLSCLVNISRGYVETDTTRAWGPVWAFVHSTYHGRWRTKLPNFSGLVPSVFTPLSKAVSITSLFGYIWSGERPLTYGVVRKGRCYSTTNVLTPKGQKIPDRNDQSANTGGLFLVSLSSDSTTPQQKISRSALAFLLSHGSERRLGPIREEQNAIAHSDKALVQSLTLPNPWNGSSFFICYRNERPLPLRLVGCFESYVRR